MMKDLDPFMHNLDALPKYAMMPCIVVHLDKVVGPFNRRSSTNIKCVMVILVFTLIPKIAPTYFSSLTFLLRLSITIRNNISERAHPYLNPL